MDGWKMETLYKGSSKQTCTSVCTEVCTRVKIGKPMFNDAKLTFNKCLTTNAVNASKYKVSKEIVLGCTSKLPII